VTSKVGRERSQRAPEAIEDQCMDVLFHNNEGDLFKIRDSARNFCSARYLHPSNGGPRQNFM